MMEPFVPPHSQGAVDDLHLRLRQTRWPETVSGAKSSLGVDREFLEDLCGYWINTFDWKAQLDLLSTLHHYRYKAKEGFVHFIYEKGEMLKIVPLLTDPAADGHDTADSFDVVIPSLPGFGYSDKPAQLGMNFFRIAEIWAEIMSALGHERFAAQGGDLGAGVSTTLGLRHSGRIIGIHLNYIAGSYRPYLSPARHRPDRKSSF